VFNKLMIEWGAKLDAGPFRETSRAALVPDHTDVRAICTMDTAYASTILPFHVQHKTFRMLFDPRQVARIITIEKVNHH